MNLNQQTQLIMQTKKLYYLLLQYFLVAVLGLLIIYIGSKIQHVTFAGKAELFLTNFLRYNFTLPVRLVFIVSGLLLGFFSRLNPFLLGLALFAVFPMGTLAEAVVLFPEADDHNLLPFEIFFYFIYAVPSILAAYLGRYFTEIEAVKKRGDSIIENIKSKHIDLINYLAFALLGIFIISLCSLFHFQFTNLLQYGGPGKNPYFFYANYSNVIIVLFFIIGLLIGYAYKGNPYLAGLSLYLIFPLGTIGSMVLGILPLKEGLFIEWVTFPFPTLIAVLIGRFLSQFKGKRPTLS